MSSLVLPLAEILQPVLERAIHVHKNGVYEMHNPTVDNFPTLLHESDFLDRAGYLMRWRQRCFEKSRGYSQFTSYCLRALSLDSLPLKDVLVELRARMFVEQATLRELLRFCSAYPKVVEALLLDGKILTAIGRDEFGANTGTAPILFLGGSQKILDQVSLSSGLWSSRHIFLLRSNRSL